VQKELVEVLQLRGSIRRRLLKESLVSHQQEMCVNQELKQELCIQKELHQELRLQMELSEGKVKELQHALDTWKDVSRREDTGEVIYFILFACINILL
jgi:hypothetical protein